MGNQLTRSSMKNRRSFDLFADALYEYHRSGKARLYTEREDGHREREDISWYFTNYREYPPFEKDALKFASGRVLDAGCGAGRHALYLQRRGLGVTAIDLSPRIVELARERGVKDARVADICRKLPFQDGEFNTALLFGNNLGLCGSAARFRKMMRELARVTTADARVIGTTRQPSGVGGRYTRESAEEPVSGQVKLRLTDGKRTGEWFDFYLFTPADLMQLADQEGWTIEYLFGDDLDKGYAVVMKKK